MMSGAIWVRDRLQAAGWRVQVAHARKVRDVAPLACKSDTVDARVLSELCRRELVCELWVPALADRMREERVCLLCLEADPRHCHRTLVAEAVAAPGGITHLHPA